MEIPSLGKNNSFVLIHYFIGTQDSRIQLFYFFVLHWVYTLTLTLIVLSKIVADDIFIFYNIFQEKIRLDICQADDSHKLSILNFSEKCTHTKM